MTRKRLADALFWLVSVAAVALLGFLFALLAGLVDVDDPAAGPQGTTPLPATSTTAAAGTTAATAEQVAATTASAEDLAVSVVVEAVRGDCWISARLGSEDGPVLAERLLAQGERLTLRGERIWLSAGAAAHVDVTVDGEARRLQPGTTTAVFGPD